MKHVSQQQLLAFRDGESDEPWIREHLATCEKCQQKFDDTRWSLSLQRVLAPPEDRHPSSEELTAFWDNALSTGAARRIQRHLRGCNRCLAVYGRMRGIEPRRAYASPAPDLMRRVQQSLSPRRVPVDLGALWLRRIGEALALTREPAAGGALVLDACPSDAAPPPASAHPASARARRSRLVPTPEPEPGGPVRLDAGRMRLELQAVERGGELLLDVKLTWADTHEPANGVRVRLETDAGVEEQARTDPQGRLSLAFPGGGSTLSVHTRSLLRLRLHGPG